MIYQYLTALIWIDDVLKILIRLQFFGLDTRVFSRAGKEQEKTGVAHRSCTRPHRYLSLFSSWPSDADQHIHRSARTV